MAIAKHSAASPQKIRLHQDVQVSARGGLEKIRLETVPDTCCRCHRSMELRPITAARVTEQRAQVVFQCTSSACRELFLADYNFTQATDERVDVYRLRKLSPMKPKEETFPEAVRKISPSFVLLHGQALAAEAHDLDQVVGIALRKALEFLVKDFAVSEQPDNADDIKKAFLGPCIEKYVEDPNVKKCAKLATWLGNDETHYVRKWENKDIEDLKKLVRLTINWIDTNVLTREYTKEMTPRTAATAAPAEEISKPPTTG